MSELTSNIDKRLKLVHNLERSLTAAKTIKDFNDDFSLREKALFNALTASLIVGDTVCTDLKTCLKIIRDNEQFFPRYISRRLSKLMADLREEPTNKKKRKKKTKVTPIKSNIIPFKRD